MKKTAIFIALLALSGASHAATAYFTGKQEMVTTVTYQQAWRCEYSYNGQYIYKIFQGSCPTSIEVY